MPHAPSPSPPSPPPQPYPTLTKLPDFLLTALSVILFVTAPKQQHLPLPSRSLTLSFPSPHPTNRRLLRLTSTSTSTMPLNPNPNPNFPTPQSLSDWLKPRLPSESLAAWGTRPGTKNVHNLWLELSDGETSLIDTTPPIRNLEVLCVRILSKDGDRVLLESHQELSDGSVRGRNRPLSEKLKAGEDIESGVKRAVKEELGSVLFGGKDGKDGDLEEIVRIVPNSYDRRIEERVSVSYPGLPACYVLHSVDAVVEGLPEGEFVTEEGCEYGEEGIGVANEAVGVKKHFWKWVPADSV